VTHNRRLALGVLALSAGSAVSARSQAQSRPRGPRRRATHTFVLVHGAWHGGWCWRDVCAILEAAGHKVTTPTLAGLGERAHLRTPTPGLDTHIQDIVAHIESEELNDVILVGHSYGGMVVTGVADKLKSRLKHVIYLDAALPQSGQSMITQNPAVASPEAIAANVAGLKSLAPDGEWMAPLPPVAFGIPADQTQKIAWVARHLTPHALKTWTDPITLNNNGSDGLPRTYILCVKPILAQTSFPAHAARIRAGQAGGGWRVIDLQTGHDAMITAPDGVASILQAIN
jgi:pimeloyl-ACP methyl ester carboxylesterase